MKKTYDELIKLHTFVERFEYLKTGSIVSDQTFGGRRLDNQYFYRSKLWKDARRSIIVRDSGCDLGLSDYPIGSRIIVHHINQITKEDIENSNLEKLLDPNNLICVSEYTHNAIHYSDSIEDPNIIIERMPNDTKLW